MRSIAASLVLVVAFASAAATPSAPVVTGPPPDEPALDQREADGERISPPAPASTSTPAAGQTAPPETETATTSEPAPTSSAVGPVLVDVAPARRVSVLPILGVAILIATGVGAAVRFLRRRARAVGSVVLAGGAAYASAIAIIVAMST